MSMSIKNHDRLLFPKKLLRTQSADIRTKRNDQFNKRRKIIFASKKRPSTRTDLYYQKKIESDNKNNRTFSNRLLQRRNKTKSHRTRIFNERRNINIPSISEGIVTPPMEDALSTYIKELQNIGREYETDGIYYINDNNIMYSIVAAHILKKYNKNCFILGLYHKTPTFVYHRPGYEGHLTGTILKFTRQLLNCIKLNKDDPESIIAIPVTLCCFTSSSCHANVLIYRNQHATIEHFEPYGISLQNTTLHNTSLEFYQTIEDIVNTMNSYNQQREYRYYDRNITYIRPEQICPRLTGLQYLDEHSTRRDNEQLFNKEGGGFCIMWSLFFTELVLVNPALTSKELLERILGLIEENKTNGSYVRNIIRGYIGILYAELNNILKEEIGMDIYEMQQHKVNINLVKYLKLKKRIESVFEDINKRKYQPNIEPDSESI